ncbi:MAG: hypothetical protein JW838_14140 [Spirochaetes bacterium]|nr:hypothetical protein [Spirochaetota bacterium]
MDYAKELKRLGKRRKSYIPVLASILEMRNVTAAANLPLELIDRDDALTILELMDIDYLDPEAFTARRRFGDIVSLLYNGGPPLSDRGLAFMKEHRASLVLMKIGRRLRKLIRR